MTEQLDFAFVFRFHKKNEIGLGRGCKRKKYNDIKNLRKKIRRNDILPIF